MDKIDIIAIGIIVAVLAVLIVSAVSIKRSASIQGYITVPGRLGEISNV